MNYYNYLSGGMTPAHLFAALTFSAMGWATYKIITAMMRNRGSQRTPPNWSWRFWIRDNWKEAAQHAFLMFVLVRFAAEIMARTIPNSAEVLDSQDPMWVYLVVGILKGYILNFWQKKKREKGY